MRNSNTYFKSYAEVISYLDKLGLFHMDFSLNRMHTAILDLIPQTNMHIIQVIGTNGKGSTSTFLSSISITHKLKTGLYTSPHFISPRERILINNNMLSECDYTYFANKIYDKIQTLTYFEFLTIMAYLSFHKSKVDLAIMEAGLGGQHDATTALPVHTLCYTAIDMDHQSVLGDTIEKIATEKALAIRSNAPIITTQQQDIVMACIKKSALKFDARVHIVPKVSDEISELNLILKGEYQKENACLALNTWNEVARQNNWDNQHELGIKGLKNAFIAGRMQYIPINENHPALILDGAHNYHGLSSLAKSLSSNNYEIMGIIFSCMADKDSKNMTKLINKISYNIPILIPHIPHNPRAENNEFLANLLGANAIAVASLNMALEYFLLKKTNNNHNDNYTLEQSTLDIHGLQNISEQNTLDVNGLQNIPEQNTLDVNGLQNIPEQNTLDVKAMHYNSEQNIVKNTPKSILLICGSLYLLAEFFKLYPEHLQK